MVDTIFDIRVMYQFIDNLTGMVEVMEITETVQSPGIVIKMRNGKLHCDNAPAIATTCGVGDCYWIEFYSRGDIVYVSLLSATQVWSNNGVLTREDGPAILVQNEDHEEETYHWIRNGEYHRIGGPALVEVGEVTEWWVDGQLHREDGPAVQYHDTTCVGYYHRGKLHNDVGPAVINLTGADDNLYAYYLDGVKMSVDEWGSKRKAVRYHDISCVDYCHCGKLHNNVGAVVVNLTEVDNNLHAYYTDGMKILV